MEDFLADQHLAPGLRRGVGCPPLYANVLIGERFGRFPWEVEDAPLDRYLIYRAVLAAEAEARALLDGLDPDEPLIRGYGE
ncbi:MAG TPA: hypothetical protein VFI15_12295 [Candidatus Limnocylindrales bacterium]|nr:hypothetical protein [Candidatus Limnocylindrales bacterium]